MKNAKALEILSNWLQLAYRDADGTDKDSAELYEALYTVFKLISYQQAEIERLQKEVNLVSILFQDLQERYEEVQTEIERLNTENMLTISERNAFRTSFYDVLKQLKIAKSEAYKEFAEKAKEFMHNKFKTLDEYEFEYITERDIDNLLKETEGKV